MFIRKIAPLLFLLGLLVADTFAGTPPPLPPGFTLPGTGQSFRQFSSESLPSFGDGGGTNSDPTFSFAPLDTNGLWLEITGVSTNGTAYFNLHNATNQVYAIQTTTNLSNGWNVELELWPTNALVMPFPLATLNRSNLFVRAQDWTGVTENGNTTPDWWLWKYFGTTALSDTNLDSQGHTLLSDYQNGLDPNVIAFSLVATNNYVRTSSTSLPLNISHGTPYYMAVLVDSTNFAGATWHPYASASAAVTLGLTEGWHEVWIGLRGRPADAVATWQWKRLKLDYTPPALILTGPSNVVTQSIIELTGYSPEALSQIAYDLTNTNGLFTNQQALVLDQYYNTNSFEFTTNTFQAFDVPLAPGSNVITLHATDLAGNVTTTNFSFLLVSDTNAPVVSLVWPQNGMQVSGSNFTVFGVVDDLSAKVTATLVDTNGNTNTFNALIERNGQFWLEDLPLTTGTNWLSLTAVDPWGNTATTNFTVVQSSVGLTVDAFDTNHLYLPAINLTGTVSDSTLGIWVNGTQGSNHGDGTWSATDVPIPTGGTARFAVSAYPAADSVSSNTVNPQFNPSDTNSVNTLTETDKPMRVYTESYLETRSDTLNFIDDYADGDLYEQNFTGAEKGQWNDGAGGLTDALWHSAYLNPGSDSWDYHECHMAQDFLPSWYPEVLAGPLPDVCLDTFLLPTALAGRYAVNKTKGDYAYTDMWGDYHEGHAAEGFTARTKVKLFTGGKAEVTQQGLFAISGSATQVTVLDDFNTALVSGTPIDPTLITMGEAGQLDSNGVVWVAFPNNVTKDIIPTVSGMDWYEFDDPGAQKYKLQYVVPSCNPPLDSSRTTVGIGEQIYCYLSPEISVDWSVTGGGSVSSTNGPSTTVTVSKSPGTTTLHAKKNGHELTKSFTVLAPSSVTVDEAINFPLGTEVADGTTMGALTKFNRITGPTNVSFLLVHFRETNPPKTVTFPNGRNIVLNLIANTNGYIGLACGGFATDKISIGPVPISYIFNGTNYVDFSFSYIYQYQYQNESSNWIDYATITAVFKFRGSDKKCQIGYQGTNGSWQGPYNP